MATTGDTEAGAEPGERHVGEVPKTTLRELALLFLRLGATAFGDPRGGLASDRGLAPRAARTTGLRLQRALGAILAAFGVNELAVLFGASAAAMLAARVASSSKPGSGSQLYPLAPGIPIAAAAAGARAVTLPGSSLFFKIGSVLFGSGYVLLAFLRADLVQRHGWLTEAQLIDAIAVGHVTPGLVFTPVTFIGYVLAGPSGALVAMANIFHARSSSSR
jgi:chromate transporter